MKFLLAVVIMLFPWQLLRAQCSIEDMKSKMEIASETRRKQPETSRKAASSVLKCAEKLSEEDYKCRALNVLGFHNLMEGNTEQAYRQFRRSLNISEKIKNDTMIAIANNNLGNYYNYLGLDELALEHYLRSLNLKRKIKMVEGIDVGLVNVGIIYDKQGKHRKAIDFYREALIIKESKQDNYGIALVHENIGIAQAELHNFNASLKSFDRALSAYNAIGYTEGANAVNLSKVALFVDMKKVSNAEDLLNEIRLELLNGNDVGMIQMLYRTQFEIEVIKGNYLDALDLADSSFLYAMKTQDLQAIIDSYNDFSQAYSLTGDTFKSVEFTNKALRLKDSLNTLNNQVAIEELQLRYETEVLNNKIELQQKDIALLNLENRNSLYFIILILLITGVIIATVFWRYRLSLKQKKMLRLELNQRNKELLSFTVQTAKKNQAIQKLKESFSKEERSSKMSNEREIHSLFKEVERTEDTWQEFRMRFEKIEPAFFTALSKNYQLSETDLRICALIKLNVTTQEAANMLNITSESVNKARYRLRKKLDLPKDVELNSFIRTIS